MPRFRRIGRRRALATLAGLLALPALAGAARAQIFPVRIFFNWQSDAVIPESQPVLAFVQRRAVAGSRVTIVGHCDTAEANPERLSLARATEVQKALLALGVPAGATLTVEGKGAAEPRVPTGPNVREARNRRVDITVA